MSEAINGNEILRDKVVSLLNTATSESDISQTLACLHEVEEILIRRQNVDEDDRSALLHEFSSHVVEFHVKSSFKVKSFVINLELTNEIAITPALSNSALTLGPTFSTLLKS